MSACAARTSGRSSSRVVLGQAIRRPPPHVDRLVADECAAPVGAMAAYRTSRCSRQLPKAAPSSCRSSMTISGRATSSSMPDSSRASRSAPCRIGRVAGLEVPAELEPPPGLLVEGEQDLLAGGSRTMTLPVRCAGVRLAPSRRRRVEMGQVVEPQALLRRRREGCQPLSSAMASSRIRPYAAGLVPGSAAGDGWACGSGEWSSLPARHPRRPGARLVATRLRRPRRGSPAAPSRGRSRGPRHRARPRAAPSRAPLPAGLPCDALDEADDVVQVRGGRVPGPGGTNGRRATSGHRRSRGRPRGSRHHASGAAAARGPTSPANVFWAAPPTRRRRMVSASAGDRGRCAAVARSVDVVDPALGEREEGLEPIQGATLDRGRLRTEEVALERTAERFRIGGVDGGQTPTRWPRCRW